MAIAKRRQVTNRQPTKTMSISIALVMLSQQNIVHAIVS